MAGIALRAVAAYLPERSVCVADLPELDLLSQAQRAACLSLGVDRIAADDTLDAVDLAERAAQRAMAQAGLTADDIDALIVIESRTPQHFLISEATRLQARLGLDRALPFTVGGLGCVSVTPALLTARGLLAADPALSTILIAHGSKPATPRRYRHPVTVNGDGGLAVVVAREGRVRVKDIVLQTNGAYWDLFRVAYRDRPSTTWYEECADLTAYSFSLAVETRTRLRTLTQQALERNGLGAEDIGCHLSQNLSTSTFHIYQEQFGTAIAAACFDNLRRYGHLGPNDVLLNLQCAIERGELPDGATAVVLNASPSAAWSVLLVENGEPSRAAHYL